MTDREKLIALIREGGRFHEEAKEKWILGGKQGERPCLIESVVDHLLANGVVVREKGEWRRVYEEGEGWVDICTRCKEKGDETDFCPNCGADMRGAKSE